MMQNNLEEKRVEGARPPEFRHIYRGKFLDRNRDINAAGVLTYAEGETVEKTLKPTIFSAPPPPMLPTVEKYRDYTNPRLESVRVHYGHANDPKDYELLTHGLKSDEKSFKAKDTLNPDVITNFENLKQNVNERVYLSKKLKPLGEVPVNNLPETIDKYTHVFGISSHKDEGAGEIINPKKLRNLVESETNEKHTMYVLSHKDYDTAEQKVRRYNRSFDPNKRFGLVEPVDYAGKATKQALDWLPTKLLEERAELEPTRLDKFREKHTSQVGKTLDPNKETRFIGPDHVFGLTNTADNFGAGDVIHGRSVANTLKGRERERAYLAALRSHLTRYNYVKFASLADAFRFYDKDGDGFVSKSELNQACTVSGFPISEHLLDALLKECDDDQDCKLSFLEFSNFLCYKDSMKLQSKGDKEEIIKPDQLMMKNKVPDGQLVPKTIANQIDKKVGSWKTTYDIINEAPFRLEPLKKRVYGLASIRNDLIAPEFRKIQDKTNYGNDGTAWSLISPSIFAQHGVYERDVLRPRAKEEINAIFKSIGMEISRDDFECIWSEASSKNPYGEVSVEEFRKVLDQKSAAALPKRECEATAKIECLGQA